MYRVPIDLYEKGNAPHRSACDKIDEIICEAQYQTAYFQTELNTSPFTKYIGIIPYVIELHVFLLWDSLEKWYFCEFRRNSKFFSQVQLFYRSQANFGEIVYHRFYVVGVHFNSLL